MALAGFKVSAVEDDFCAVAAHGVDLDRVGAFRDDDDGAGVEELGRVGDGLAVVAGGGGNHAAGAFFRRKMGHEVDAAAHFEGADGLVVLVLDMDFGAHEVIEARVVVERRGVQIAADDGVRREDVSEGGEGLVECAGVSPCRPSRDDALLAGAPIVYVWSLSS